MKRGLMTVALLVMAATLVSAQEATKNRLRYGSADVDAFVKSGLFFPDGPPAPPPMRPGVGPAMTEAELLALWRDVYPPAPPPQQRVNVDVDVYVHVLQPPPEPSYVQPYVPYLTPPSVPVYVQPYLMPPPQVYHFTPIPAPQLHTPPLQRFYRRCTQTTIGGAVYTNCF